MISLLMSDSSLSVTLPFPSDYYADLPQLTIANCMGRFVCWVKAPGKCVIRDNAVKIYPMIAKCENLIYVIKVKYGSYDTVMKAML